MSFKRCPESESNQRHEDFQSTQSNRQSGESIHQNGERLLGRESGVPGLGWLILLGAVLFGLTLLGLVGAVADLQAGPLGMVIGTGLLALGMLITPMSVEEQETEEQARADAAKSEEVDTRAEDAAEHPGLTGCLDPDSGRTFSESIKPIIERVNARQERVLEALRAYHAGADRGELKALLVEMWGPPVEATAAGKEDLPRCGRTTVILAKRRVCVLPASHDGVHEDDVGAWWTEGESDPVFAKEVAAHPTMMGLAGGGVPSALPPPWRKKHLDEAMTTWRALPDESRGEVYSALNNAPPIGSAGPAIALLAVVAGDVPNDMRAPSGEPPMCGEPYDMMPATKCQSERGHDAGEGHWSPGISWGGPVRGKADR